MDSRLPISVALLVFVLATHQRRQSIVFYGDWRQSAIRIFLTDHYQLRERTAQCHFNDDKRIVSVWHRCGSPEIRTCPEIRRPDYLKFIFYVPKHIPTSEFPDFKVLDATRWEF